MRLLTVLAPLSVALVISACGSTNTAQTVTSGAVGPATGGSSTLAAPQRTYTYTATATTATTSTVASPSVTATPATVTTATITAPDSGGAPLSGTSSTADAAMECTAAALKVAAVPPNSGPGTTVLGFELTNASAHSCTSGGWPGIALISASDQVADISTTRTTSDDLGSTPETKLTLAPGQVMSFRVTLHDDGADCHSYGGVQVIAPNDTAPLDAQIADGPVQSCGAVAVSPVEPGASATGQ